MRIAMRNVRFVENQDGGILLDIETDRFFSLNTTAAFIWHCLMDGGEPRGIAQKLATETGTDADFALTDIHALISYLEARGLLRPPTPELNTPSRLS